MYSEVAALAAAYITAVAAALTHAFSASNLKPGASGHRLSMAGPLRHTPCNRCRELSEECQDAVNARKACYRCARFKQ